MSRAVHNAYRRTPQRQDLLRTSLSPLRRHPGSIKRLAPILDSHAFIAARPILIKKGVSRKKKEFTISAIEVANPGLIRAEAAIAAISKEIMYQKSLIPI